MNKIKCVNCNHSIKNTVDQDSRHENLALSTKQRHYMKVGSKLYYSCKYLAITLNLTLL